MKPEALQRLIGLPPAQIEALGPLQVWADFGNGPELVGRAQSMAEAMDLLAEQLAGADYDPDVIADMPDLAGEPFLVRALFYELSEDQLMQRTFDPAQLVYLSSVPTDHPTLRLVVAWEAVPHRQDTAIGVFREERAPGDAT